MSEAGAVVASARLGGTLLSAPSCPVERPDSPCPPRPVDDGTVELIRGQTQVARVRTDKAGRFHLVARPGTYSVRATNAGGMEPSR